MLDSLITGDLPNHLKVKIAARENWPILMELWNCFNPRSSVRFFTHQLSWCITEQFNSRPCFFMERDSISKDRNTIIDEYGLLGLSLIDLKQKSVIITEGVSDFFSVKLLCPYRNVLGVTTLGGSRNAKALLLNLFDTFTICADNDETGLKNAARWKNFLESYGKQVNIFSSPLGKDITDSFIFNIKLNQ